MRDAFADAGYRRILAEPDFNKIPFVGPLPDLMGQILGPSGFCYPLKFPRVSSIRLPWCRINPAATTRTTGRCKICSPLGYRWAPFHARWAA